MRAVVSLLVMLAATGIAAQVTPPSIALPPELDRVLRDYERHWRAKDAAALAMLFAEDGYVLASGKPPARGRAAIREAYAQSGGPLYLRAFSFSTHGSTGYILGGYRAEEAGPDHGKFVLALRKSRGRWLIAADIDNANQRSRPPAATAQ
ncbi:MAG: nuclear transport factor 2 family protein [Acidobacteriota bacterium]